MVFVYQTMKGRASSNHNKKTTTAAKVSARNATSASSTCGGGDGGGVMETARELLKSWSADFGVVDTTSLLTSTLSLQKKSEAAAATADSLRLGGSGLKRTMSDGDCSDDTPVTRFRKDAAAATDDANGKSPTEIIGGCSGSFNTSSGDDHDNSSSIGFSDEDDGGDDVEIGNSMDDGEDGGGPALASSDATNQVGVDANGGEAERKRKNKKGCFSRPILRPAAGSFQEEGIEIISRKRPLVRGRSSVGSSSRRSMLSKEDSNVSSDDPAPPTATTAAAAATDTSTCSNTSRLSEDRIQEILVAAMRYQTEHAATLPSPLPNHYISQHHHTPQQHARSLPTSPETAYLVAGGLPVGTTTITSPLLLVPRPCLSPPPTVTIAAPSLLPTTAAAQHHHRTPPPSQLLLPKLKTPPGNTSIDATATATATRHSIVLQNHDPQPGGDVKAAAVNTTCRSKKNHVDLLHAFDDLHTTDALLMAEKALRHVEEAAESRASSSSSSTSKSLSQDVAVDSHHRGGSKHPPPLSSDNTRPWGAEDQRRGLETIFSVGSEGDSSITHGPADGHRTVLVNDDQQQLLLPEGQRAQKEEQQQLNRQWQQQYLQQQKNAQQRPGSSQHQQPVEVQQQGSVEWTTPSADSDQPDDDIPLLPLPSEEDTLLTTLMSESEDPVNEARRDVKGQNDHGRQHSPKHHPIRSNSRTCSSESATTMPRAAATRQPGAHYEEVIEVDGLVQDFGNSNLGLCEDEKKEAHPSDAVVRSNESLRLKENDRPREAFEEEDIDEDLELVKSFSATESDVGSLDGLPFNLQSQLHDGDHGLEDLMKRLDGVVVHTTPLSPDSGDAATTTTNGPGHERSPSFFESLGFHTTTPLAAPETAAATAETNAHDDQGDTLHDPPDLQQHRHERSPSFFKSLGLSYFFGGGDGQEGNQQQDGSGYNVNDSADDTLALLGCAPVLHNHEERNRLPAMSTSLIRVTREPPPLSYAETIRATEVDPRLQDWLEGYYRVRGQPPSDGNYHLGKSRTVIVHEINRGNWTWCTAWSPSGDRLAVATENHHLAVIETTASTVWRVRHDRRIVGPAKNDVTHSIRSISWGQNFIAIGGTGNAVSILSPIEPYPIVHVIKGTGFVGKLAWKVDSNILAIGSRLNKMMIVRVKSIDRGKIIESEILHTVQFANWVNRVSFSPGGSCLAVGDASGLVSVYNCVDEPYEPFEISLVDTFQLEDSVLDMEWAPDGRWLYVGGEDFHITVIETNYWEVVHRIKRDRWVQCIASSNGGNFLAVGGADSEISILDVKNGWDSVMGIGLKGLVPLWVEWHPKDQALALTGQNNSVMVVETTNARHVKGHHLHSISPTLAVEFSPDGRMAVMGNEAGIVTFFSLSGVTFETAYELVVTLNDRLSISWSMNGVFVAIGTKDTLLIVGSDAPLSRNRDATKRSRPPSASGFAVRKVFRNIGETNVVAIDTQSRYVAAGGDRTRIYDATADFKLVKEWLTGVTHAIAWSPDGKLLATFGEEKNLTIYDVANKKVGRWRAIFSLNCDFTGRALAWSPVNIGGLLYLAYGGRNNNILIMEIRTLEGTWETVLRIPRDGAINDMDWSSSGLLAVGIGNGTVTIIDLAYLHSGIPVNEKDYNWQRQALTCFTEIRRNRGKNSIRTVRWIPSAPGSDSLLAMGGTDGEVEIVDLTERERCRGYVGSLA